ncbi:Twinfilin-1 [Dimargaris verticillata]|uniref:Twinfilin-1 n=1 Tax=Dimargaris verticillata TaxID=2761393 RepID=A0A9W8ECP8_9FUNG|nr:Twinfilin-1 [Dimargaris verticillata]
MSHQTGIQVSPALADAFAEAGQPTSDTRLIVVRITDAALSSTTVVAKSSDHDSDYTVVPLAIKDQQPSYLLYRLEPVPSVDDNGDQPSDDQWLLISYVPDDAKVRDKMIYAATQATLAKQLGTNKFAHTVCARSRKDLNFDTLTAFYRYHDLGPSAEADLPLSERERELRKVKLEETLAAGAPATPSTRRAHVVGVQFGISDEIHQAFAAVNENPHAYTNHAVLLSIDGAESVALDTHPSNGNATPFAVVSPEALAKHLPTDEPRYVVYWFRPDNATDSASKVTSDAQLAEAEESATTFPVFMYWCPIASPIKLRMLYSSMRYGVTIRLTENFGVEYAKRLELDDASDLTTAYVLEELEPAMAKAAAQNQLQGLDLTTAPAQQSRPLAKMQFKRPTAPGRPRKLPSQQ